MILNKVKNWEKKSKNDLERDGKKNMKLLELKKNGGWYKCLKENNLCIRLSIIFFYLDLYNRFYIIEIKIDWFNKKINKNNKINK